MNHWLQVVAPLGVYHVLSVFFFIIDIKELAVIYLNTVFHDPVNRNQTVFTTAISAILRQDSYDDLFVGT